jgi:hypothetical protein
MCVLLLAVTAHTSSALLLPTQQQQPFTLNGAKTLTLMFRLKPLQQQPTPPPAYVNAPMNRWDFTGGDGYLLITRGDMGPIIGVLSEMMWFQGRFRPRCSNATFFSAQRFWVDLKISQDIGRTYWGFPKVSSRHRLSNCIPQLASSCRVGVAVGFGDSLQVGLTVANCSPMAAVAAVAMPGLEIAADCVYVF